MPYLSPTARSLAHLRRHGALAGTVERWNPHVKPHGIRQDLFRFADLVAVGYGGITGTLYIQACAAGDHARRLRKLTTDEKVAPRVQKVIQSGNSVAVWSWAVRGRRGKRKLWTLKETRIASTATYEWKAYTIPLVIADTGTPRSFTAPRADVLEQVRRIAERDGAEPDTLKETRIDESHAGEHDEGGRVAG